MTDAFISHSHEDANVAVRIEQGLTARGLSVWIDRDNIRGGGVLVDALQTALEHSRNIIVLWSAASKDSEWVNSEWTAVVNWNHERGIKIQKGIIPCRLDPTPLAMFLGRYVFCDVRTSLDEGLACLVKALKGTTANTPSPAPYAPPEFVKKVLRGQDSVIAALMGSNLAQAKKLQSTFTTLVDQALREYPDDAYLVTVAGYDKKNEYMIRHWSDLQAGRFPQGLDPLLDQAMGLFFRALSTRPDDPSALNGLGSVFLLRRDLDAAEFYIQRALVRSKEEHLDYGAAEHDLALVRRLKRPSLPQS